MTMKNSINEVVTACHGASMAAGWWDNTDVRGDRHVVPAKLCLIHSEISEAMEGHRKGLMDDKLPHRPMIEVELADALIRIADLAGVLGLDLGGAVVEKMAFNAQRDYILDCQNDSPAQSGGQAGAPTIASNVIAEGCRLFRDWEKANGGWRWCYPASDAAIKELVGGLVGLLGLNKP